MVVKDIKSNFLDILRKVISNAIPTKDERIVSVQGQRELEAEMKKAIEDSYDLDTAFNSKPEFEELKLEKIEYQAPSDEEIKKSAEDMFKEYGELSKTAIEQEAKSSLANINQNKQQLENDKNYSESYVNELANSRMDNTSKEALKRGLARSSIVINQLANIDREKAEQLVSINNEYLKQIAEADLKIGELEVQKNTALKNLEATLATKIATQIATLSAQRDEKVAEAIKYNNSLAEKIADYNISKQKAEADIWAKNNEAIKDKVDIQSSYDYQMYIEQKRYEIIKEFMFSLSKDASIDLMVNDPYYKAQLNSNYYTVLLNELRGR